MADKRSQKPKVFDVTKPGQTPADATSRPIIVGHKKTIDDPMVVVEDVDTNQGEAPPSKKSKPEFVINPSNEEIETPDSPTDTVPEEDTIIEPASEENVGANSAVVNDLVGDVGTKNDQKIADQEARKYAEKINGLVNSKKYFVKTRVPKSKRHLRLVVLLILLVATLLAWYLLAGPGKDMISPNSDQPALVNSASKDQPDKIVQKTDSASGLVDYKNEELGIAFQHPADWKVFSAKDELRSGVNVVTIDAPTQKITTSFKDVPEVESEVFMRTKIFVQNITTTEKYPTLLTGVQTCSSEDITLDSQSLRLLFISVQEQAGSITSVNVSPDNCIKEGDIFTPGDQFQLATKTGFYRAQAEYIFSEAHLKSIGTTNQDSIKIAQASGVVITKERFKSTDSYRSFVSILQSLKEL